MAMFQNEKERKLVIECFGEDIQYPSYLHSIDYCAFNEAIAARVVRRKWKEKIQEEEYAEEVEIPFNTENRIQEKAIQEKTIQERTFKSHSIKAIQESHSIKDIQLTFNTDIQ